MPITPAQKTAVEEIIHLITAATAGSRGKRQLAGMFLELVDREEWPEYYEIIPEPRCLRNIQQSLDKNRYKEATDVYRDLSLVFWNALYYNEAGSQIALDAETLKHILETEWKKRTVLPSVRTSPPPASAQKVHARVEANTKPKTVDTKGKAKMTTQAPAPVKNTTATPQPQPQAQPVATTSQPPPVQDANTSPSSPEQEDEEGDIEVDILSESSDEEPSAFNAERDPRSDDIVRQLERGLPRWPGYGEEGWLTQLSLEKMSDIVHVIKSHKDVIGNRLAVAIENIPEDNVAASTLPPPTPLSFKQIETRTRHKTYKSAADFDKDMCRLFTKARRCHEPGSESYSRVLLLQRLYQALTSLSDPLAPPYVSTTNFASLKAGPGNVKPVHGSGSSEGVAGVTSARISMLDRTFTNETHYKGWSIKVGDWVHLANPDDPSRPIVGQVFKCWTSDESGSRKDQPGITVAWYYRPEQTFHSATRQFWEGEVFKTNHFADHPLDDIIEKISCQFTSSHIRGRPRPPVWHVGFPLYVCDSRYNDRDRTFTRLKAKRWSNYVPDEIRLQHHNLDDYMPIYPFEKTIYPAKVPSPFLTGTANKAMNASGKKGSGGLIDGGVANLTHPNPTIGTGVGGPGYSAQQSSGHTQPPQQNYSSYYPNYPSHPVAQAPTTPAPIRPAGPDRSVVTAAGGYVTIGGPSQVEKLPSATAQLFDRDPETNEVLWFAGPPVNHAHPTTPRHSLAYLRFLAEKKRSGQQNGGQKRKTGPEGAGGLEKEDQGEDTNGVEVVNGVEGGVAKSKKARTSPGATWVPPPTATETVREVFKEMGLEGEPYWR